jgi:hypothetical protein
MRIYHFHVRKSAGTSMNAAFWSLGGLSGAEDWKEREGEGLRYVRHDAGLIEKGEYFFACSHIPAHVLRLPPDTFSLTILRDPAARVISYYRYLVWARSGLGQGMDPYIDEVRDEGAFLEGSARYALAQLRPERVRAESAVDTLGLGQFLSRWARLPFPARSFEGFLARVPPRKLLTQLHMFSRRLDPAEAAEKILSCDFVCFTESFSDDLARLGSALGLPLEVRRDRQTPGSVELTERERELLRARLQPEYRMLELVRDGLGIRAPE